MTTSTINSREALQRLLKETKVIAVVGLSPNADRPSHGVAQYLIAAGYQVIPVNPTQDEILGQTCYPDLKSIPIKVDMVDVFRKAEDALEVARDAVQIGAHCLWLQLGVINEEAAATAAAGGLHVVMDRCVKIDHRELMG